MIWDLNEGEINMVSQGTLGQAWTINGHLLKIREMDS